MATAYLVKTKMGTFFYPPNYMVATVGGADAGVSYNFPFEVRPGSKVLLRKDVADGLDLREDVIPSLWAQSKDYRLDRRYVFMDGASGMSERTRLGEYLRRNAEKIGVGELEAADLFKEMMLPESEYSKSTILDWMRDKTMFPQKDPRAAVYLAKKLGDADMEGWATDLVEMEPKTNPVSRLRVLHSCIMSAMSMPTGESFGKSRKRPGGPNHVIGVSEYIKMIKNYYGGDVLNEITVPVEIVGVKEVSYDRKDGGTGGARAGGELKKSLLGFSSGDREAEGDVTSRYRGSVRSREIEQGLADSVPVLVGKVLQAVVDSLGGKLYERTTEENSKNREIVSRRFDVNEAMDKLAPTYAELYTGFMMGWVHRISSPLSSLEEVLKMEAASRETELKLSKDKAIREFASKSFKDGSVFGMRPPTGVPIFDYNLEYCMKLYGPMERFVMGYKDFNSIIFANQEKMLKGVAMRAADDRRFVADKIKSEYEDMTQMARDLFSSGDVQEGLMEYRSALKGVPGSLAAIRTVFDMKAGADMMSADVVYSSIDVNLRKMDNVRRLARAYGLDSMISVGGYMKEALKPGAEEFSANLVADLFRK